MPKMQPNPNGRNKRLKGQLFGTRKLVVNLEKEIGNQPGTRMEFKVGQDLRNDGSSKTKPKHQTPPPPKE